MLPATTHTPLVPGTMGLSCQRPQTIQPGTEVYNLSQVLLEEGGNQVPLVTPVLFSSLISRTKPKPPGLCEQDSLLPAALSTPNPPSPLPSLFLPSPLTVPSRIPDL